MSFIKKLINLNKAKLNKATFFVLFGIVATLVIILLFVDISRQIVSTDSEQTEDIKELVDQQTLENRLEEAVAYYRKAINLDPNYNNAYQMLGFALLGLGISFTMVGIPLFVVFTERPFAKESSVPYVIEKNGSKSSSSFSLPRNSKPSSSDSCREQK